MQANIKIADHQKEVDVCMQLRRVVFIDEQGVSEEEEIDGEDEFCTHVLANIGEEPVGAARLHLSDDYAKIQRVCVSKSHRGKNIGAEIIRFMIQHIRHTTDAKSIRLGAQIHACEFYRRLGFGVIGSEYLDAGIPHVDMTLQISGTT